MKNSIFKGLLTLVFVGTTVMFTNAQVKRPRILFGGNGSYNQPRGSFANAYKFGVAGEVFGGVGVGKTFVVATVGASNFFADKENSYGNLVYKPVKIGIRHFLLSNKIFINGDVGTGYIKDKTMNNSESKFTAGIGVGARLLGLEGGLYYNNWKALHAAGFSSTVQFKVGWSMTL